MEKHTPLFFPVDCAYTIFKNVDLRWVFVKVNAPSRLGINREEFHEITKQDYYEAAKENGWTTLPDLTTVAPTTVEETTVAPTTVAPE